MCTNDLDSESNGSKAKVAKREQGEGKVPENQPFCDSCNQREKWRFAMEILALTAAIVAGIVAAYQLHASARANQLQAYAMLCADDAERSKAMSADAIAASIWINPSTSATNNLMKTRERIRASLLPSNDVCWRNILSDSNEWHDMNVTNIHTMLWDKESFDSSNGVRLRIAYTEAENELGLIAKAFHAREMGVIDTRIWETWAAYIDELGGHPLFLTAIYEGRTHGYYTPEFLKEVVSRLVENKDICEVVTNIYPSISRSE